MSSLKVKPMVDIKIQLPSDFFEEEERSGFIVSHKQKEIWALELDLLNELIRVCNKYNINYYADGGTLLGAVRHKGFIPWDDDIDIVIMRSDYQKLEEVAPYEFKCPYFWQTEKTDIGSMRGHAQIRNIMTTGILESEINGGYTFNQGVFIDIFPLDNVPNDIKERESFFDEISAQRQKSRDYTYATVRSEKSKDLRLLHLLEGHGNTYYNESLYRNVEYFKFEELICKYNSSHTDNIAKLFFRNIKEKLIWETEWFSDICEVEFETLTLNAPIGYQQLLTKFYGDWQVPQKQATAHGGVIFDTDKSYQAYLKEVWKL